MILFVGGEVVGDGVILFVGDVSESVGNKYVSQVLSVPMHSLNGDVLGRVHGAE